MESILTNAMDKAGIKTEDDADEIAGCIFGRRETYESLQRLIPDLQEDWYTQRGSRLLREARKEAIQPD